MPWKMDGDKIVVQDGHPVWVYPEGKESPFNAESALSRINELTTESVGRKKKLQDQEEKLKVLEGIDNPGEFVKTAKEAIKTVKNLDDKKLVDAGEVEKVKQSVASTYKEKIAGLEAAYDKRHRLLLMILSGSILRSRFRKTESRWPWA